jgi:hypothetical protein
VAAAAALGRLAREVARFADDWPRHGAEVAAGVLRGELAADGGGSFSNAPGMSARVEVRPGSGSAEVVGAGGGWTWLQHGTRAHTVNARSGGFLRTPFGPRRRIEITGMAAKGTWTKGAGRAVDAAQRDAAAAFSKAVG